MWKHTVLEIYRLETDWPEGYVPQILSWPEHGEPADWIEEGLIGYCQGAPRDLVSFIPLRTILQWRVKDWVAAIRKWLLTQTDRVLY